MHDGKSCDVGQISIYSPQITGAYVAISVTEDTGQSSQLYNSAMSPRCNESYNAARQELTEQEDYHFLLRKSTSGVAHKTIQHKKRHSSALTPPTIHLAISAHNPPGNLRPQYTQKVRQKTQDRIANYITARCRRAVTRPHWNGYLFCPAQTQKGTV